MGDRMNRELLVNEEVSTLIRVTSSGDVRPTSFIWRDRTRYIDTIGRHWEEMVNGKRLHCYLLQAVDSSSYELQWDPAANIWLLHRAWLPMEVA